MALPPPNRIDVLAGRVRWLDRYRRAISIVIAVAFWVALQIELHALIGDRWPSALPMIIAIMFAVASWWVVEAAFAWLTALWETQHDRLARDRGLPRAELLVRRR